jgi:hypothetical protein
MSRLNLDEIHRRAVANKVDRVTGLEALIQTHEMFGDGEDPEHAEYMRDLRRKLRAARVQLEAMRP